MRIHKPFANRAWAAVRPLPSRMSKRQETSASILAKHVRLSTSKETIERFWGCKLAVAMHLVQNTVRGGLAFSNQK